MLPAQFRRSFSVGVVTFNFLFLIGIISDKGILQIGIFDNIMNTGVTPAIILSLLNIVLLYLVVKHQVP